MKKLIFILSLLFTLNATINAQNKIPKPEIGDVLMVNAPDGTTYNHVFFPRLNFLVKRGKVANYKSVYGKKVVVKDVFEKNGATYVMLTPKNGEKFFGHVSKVKANYSKSINSGELSKVKESHKKSSKQESLAMLRL
ncbi:hypothetical protein [Algibacter sp. 2305UL17-15]|uniref:hypothetical protein n=1 Tax=Algibacter sp. 2305UL17-15 TaxID=3231268 RepID=UPI00345AC54F